jgi:hypothetical protein
VSRRKKSEERKQKARPAKVGNGCIEGVSQVCSRGRRRHRPEVGEHVHEYLRTSPVSAGFNCRKQPEYDASIFPNAIRCRICARAAISLYSRILSSGPGIQVPGGRCTESSSWSCTCNHPSSHIGKSSCPCVCSDRGNCCAPW